MTLILWHHSLMTLEASLIIEIFCDIGHWLVLLFWARPHLKGALLSQGLALLGNVLLGINLCPGMKHSSLFVQSVNDEEKNLIKLTPSVTIVKASFIVTENLDK